METPSTLQFKTQSEFKTELKKADYDFKKSMSNLADYLLNGETFSDEKVLSLLQLIKDAAIKVRDVETAAPEMKRRKKSPEALVVTDAEPAAVPTDKVALNA